MHPRNRQSEDRAYDLLDLKHQPDGSVLALVWIPAYGRLRVYVDRQQASGAGIAATVLAAVEHKRPKPPQTDWSE